MTSVPIQKAKAGPTAPRTGCDRRRGCDSDHRDPFDRMLIAQARSDDLIRVSNEKLFDAFGVTRLW